MTMVDNVEAIAGVGLSGDRYAMNTGFWRASLACQVTLIGTLDITSAIRRAPPEQRDRLTKGHHRRNLVVDGLEAQTLLNKRFRIGEAVFAYSKPRPPCGYLDRIEGAGLSHALSQQGGGICIDVIESGRLNIGDAAEILGIV